MLTTNGDDDLARAQRIITFMVTKFGMAQSLEMIAFPDTEYMKKPYSETVAQQIDIEIKTLR